MKSDTLYGSKPFWNILCFQGTKVPMFYRPEWIEKEEKDWEKLCYGRTLCLAVSDKNVAIGSADGWVVIYDLLTGLGMKIDQISKKPSHPAPVSILNKTKQKTQKMVGLKNILYNDCILLVIHYLFILGMSNCYITKQPMGCISRRGHKFEIVVNQGLWQSTCSVYCQAQCDCDHN